MGTRSKKKLKLEFDHLAKGFQFIAGVDEVGMGCLAGPVVAAAVILNMSLVPDGIDDSKKLSEKKRVELDVKIKECAVHWAIGIATVEEIDELNIYHAGRLAMCRAIENLTPKPDFVLADGRGILKLQTPYLMVVKGDALSVSIGAASIVAKVHRDTMMNELDGQYPGYGFASHKGYGSVTHRQSLQAKGRSPIHRKSFDWTPV